VIDNQIFFSSYCELQHDTSCQFALKSLQSYFLIKKVTSWEKSFSGLLGFEIKGQGFVEIKDGFIITVILF